MLHALSQKEANLTPKSPLPATRAIVTDPPGPAVRSPR